MSLGSIFGAYMLFSQDFITRQKEMSEHFEKEAEEAKKKYWDACKYPRKTKKKMRKEALVDFSLYTELAKPLHYIF